MKKNITSKKFALPALSGQAANFFIDVKFPRQIVNRVKCNSSILICYTKIARAMILQAKKAFLAPKLATPKTAHPNANNSASVTYHFKEVNNRFKKLGL